MAKRRDEQRFPDDGNTEDAPAVPDRAIADEEVVAAADKYKVPGAAPAWIAASLRTRDTEHQMTLPGFALSRWWMYVAGRPVVATFFFFLPDPCSSCKRNVSCRIAVRRLTLGTFRTHSAPPTN